MERATDRQERVAWWRQELLENANIAVIGAGALGNEVLKNLALMGVGHLHVFDFDRIESSNLSRTVLFGPDTLGRPKAAVAAQRALALNVNKNASVQSHHIDVVWELGGGYLRRMNLVLGCLDNLEARLAIGRACYQLGVPFIDGGIRELSGRVQFHHSGSGACVDCTIGEGERIALQRRYSCLNVMRSFTPRDIVPTVQVSSAFVAAIMAQESIKFLQGKPVPFGSVISWFGETNDFGLLRLIKRSDCTTCSVPPPRPVVTLGLKCADSVGSLLTALGDGWSVILPSPFIISISCGLCGRLHDVGKPSYQCVDTSLACLNCNNAELITLTSVDQVSSNAEPHIRSLSLSQLGFPPLATMVGVNGEEVRMFELSGDEGFIQHNKESQS